MEDKIVGGGQSLQPSNVLDTPTNHMEINVWKCSCDRHHQFPSAPRIEMTDIPDLQPGISTGFNVRLLDLVGTIWRDHDFGPRQAGIHREIRPPQGLRNDHESLEAGTPEQIALNQVVPPVMWWPVTFIDETTTAAETRK